MADLLAPPAFNHNLSDYGPHAEYVKTLGVDPHSNDDTEFGTKFIYCASHLRSHSTGWCTVHNVQKVPLTADTTGEAIAEVITLGFKVYQG